jgi:hypothetical protein
MSETRAAMCRIQCAAITRGCTASLTFDAPPGVDAYRLVREVPEDRRVGDLLTLNGWRLDHGRWVCGNHPA